MTRRVHYIKTKKQRQKQEFMLGYRRALENIDPALLKTARDAIAKALIHLKEQESDPQSNMVPVDTKKNLSIIAKYLEIHPGSEETRREIKVFLSEEFF